MAEKKVFTIKIVIFLLLLGIILWRLNTIFLLKEYPVGANVNFLIDPYVLCDKQDGFYALEENTLDVVFVGSSNIHCNINPNVIWNQYGITSYDYSCDQQEMGTSYYYLQQVFKTQSPKVVVVDVMEDGNTDSIPNQTAHFAFDHMKNDWIRFDAIMNRTTNDRVEMLFPLIAYHERWKELSSYDYKYKRNRKNILKGSFIYMLVNNQEMPDLPNEIPEGTLSDRTKEWMHLIYELCENNNCQCVFIKTPYAFYDESWFSYFEAVNHYCLENDIPFLYLNKLSDMIGFDYSTDFTDAMHMNWNGQVKLSIYLGKYLIDNFDFEDKRGDEKYDEWTADYNTMIYYIENFGELYNNQQS